MFVSTKTLRTEVGDFARRFDARSLTGDEAAGVLRELGQVRRLVDGLIAVTAARVDATAAYRGRGDRSAAESCAKALGSSAGEAKGMLAAGKAIAQSPALEDAARQGTITPTQAALIAATTAIAPAAEADLLEAAKAGLPALVAKCIEVRADAEGEAERRARHRKNRRLRTWTDTDGMFAGAFALEPEIGGQIKAILDDAVQRSFRAHRGTGDHEPHEAYAADALAVAFLGDAEAEVEAAAEAAERDAAGGAATGAGAAVGAGAAAGAAEGDVDAGAAAGGGRNAGGRGAAARRGRGTLITTHVVISLEALLRGDAWPGERCEIPGVGPVSAEWVRSQLGAAFLTAIVADGTDIRTVAHFGRHINAKLRTALMVQGRVCDIEGCGARGYLEIDHRHDHAKRGPTALHNLGWLCAHHHRLKSRGWILGPPGRASGKRVLIPPERDTRAA